VELLSLGAGWLPLGVTWVCSERHLLT